VSIFHNGDWNTQNWLELCLVGGMIFEFVSGSDKAVPPEFNCGFALLRKDATYYVLCVDPSFFIAIRLKEEGPEVSRNCIDWRPMPRN
jgi:hypothetical protein